MGRIFKPVYNVNGPNGERIRKESKFFHCEWTDAFGKTRHKKAASTERAAKDVLRKIEGEVLSERNGMPTRSIADIPVVEILARFISSLKTRATAAHCNRVETYIGEIIQACHIWRMKDIQPEGVEVYLATLAEDRNLGSKAINERLGAIKSMLSWATRSRIIPYSPLDCIVRREHHKRHNRRALNEEEISKLMAAALDGPRRRALRVYQNRERRDGTMKPASIPLTRQAELAQNGRRIALAYRLMLEVGLRRSEVRNVSWSDVDLEAGTLTTRSHWDGNKNGLEEVLPIPPGLIAALKGWHRHRGKPTTGAIVKISSRLLRSLNDDLVAAGIARRVPFDPGGKQIPLDLNGKPERKPKCWKIVKTDAAGRTIDLHALRHTFGTRLGKIPGIDPKTVQTLMRHQDPRLTFGVYVHSDKQRLQKAVEDLPDVRPMAPRRPAKAAVKTGTDGRAKGNTT